MFSHTISLGLLKTAFKYHFKGCEFLNSSCFVFPTNECQKSLFMRMFHAWYVWASEEFTKVKQSSVVNAFCLERWNI